MVEIAPRAVIVPFSSIVGGSLTLHAPDGRCEAQLAILGAGMPGDDREAWKAKVGAIAEEVASALNLYPEMRALIIRIQEAHESYMNEGGGEMAYGMDICEAVADLAKRAK